MVIQKACFKPFFGLGRALLFCFFCSNLSVGNPFLAHIHIRVIPFVCRWFFRIVRYPLSINFFLMLPESVLAHAEILADFAHRGGACVLAPDAWGKVCIDHPQLGRQIPITYRHSQNDATTHRKYIYLFLHLIHHLPYLPIVGLDIIATMNVNWFLVST